MQENYSPMASSMRAEPHSEGSRVWVVLEDRPYRNGKTLPVSLAFLTPQPSGLRTEENPNYWLFSPDEVVRTAKLFAVAPRMLVILQSIHAGEGLHGALLDEVGEIVQDLGEV